MQQQNFLRTPLLLIALILTACQSGPSSTPDTAPTAADVRACETLTRRILDRPMDDRALIRKYEGEFTDALMPAE